ncbi:hypothetical protein ACFQUU_27250 [Herbaspirillum sp. GCM10030257]|uniref:hypothetical protein n=1 Tax=Herbaspirillum sp. GCM10030257 TaxID=3273393 RepID=UPI003611642F
MSQMPPTLPSGAKAIVDMRLKGEKPADMLIVSLVGKVQDKLIQQMNPTVYANAKPAVPYDWRWVVQLKLCIYTNPLTDWRQTAATIAKHRPEWLGLWDVDTFEGGELYLLPKVEDIEKPKQQWRWDMHFLPWLPFQNHQFAHED